MADGRSTRARLLRLTVELSQERLVAESIAAQARSDAARLRTLGGTKADPDELHRGTLAVLAVGLHRWYSALESMLERVERTFGTMPTGADWHTDLLVGATLEIPEVRPPLLPAEHLEALRNLLKFRHFFRHAYAVELDKSRLLIVADDLEAAAGPVHGAIRHFETFLTTAAHALTDGH